MNHKKVAGICQCNDIIHNARTFSLQKHRFLNTSITTYVGILVTGASRRYIAHQQYGIKAKSSVQTKHKK